MRHVSAQKWDAIAGRGASQSLLRIDNRNLVRLKLVAGVG